MKEKIERLIAQMEKEFQQVPPHDIEANTYWNAYLQGLYDAPALVDDDDA